MLSCPCPSPHCWFLKFSRPCYRFHLFPPLLQVSCFPALVAGSLCFTTHVQDSRFPSPYCRFLKFPRPCCRFHVLPPLLKALHVFPPFLRVPSFPAIAMGSISFRALVTSSMFSRPYCRVHVSPPLLQVPYVFPPSL